MTCVLPCFLLFLCCSMPNWVGKVEAPKHRWASAPLGSRDAHRSASRDSATKQSLSAMQGTQSRGLVSGRAHRPHPAMASLLLARPGTAACTQHPCRDFLFYHVCNYGPRHCAARPLSLALCTDLVSHPAPSAEFELLDHGRRPGVFFLSFLFPLLFRILHFAFLGCIRLFWGHRGHDDTVHL